MSWIQTESGKRLDLINPDESLIDLRDVAWGLAGKNRYADQLSLPWTVAAHSMLLARIVGVLCRGQGDEALDPMRLALLHDGHEFITGDLPSPFKGLPEFEPFRRIEAEWEARFQRVFHLRGSMDAPLGSTAWTLRKLDKAIVECERLLFHRHVRDDWRDGVAAGVGAPCVPLTWFTSMPSARKEQIKLFLAAYGDMSFFRAALCGEDAWRDWDAYHNLTPRELVKQYREHAEKQIRCADSRG